MASLFQNREYQALPEQEKFDHEIEAETQTQSLPTHPRSQGRSKKFYIAIASLIAVVLLAFVGIASSWTSSTDIPPDFADAVPMDDESREFLANLGRAGDQQYLLGVGKADITGLVATCENEYIDSMY